MFEAKLAEGNTFKKIVDSIKDLVQDVNLDIGPSGISLQAMDSSHVALVSLHLSMEGFETYRADKAMVIGISVSNLAKVMKLAGSDDSITLQAENDASHLKITFENNKNGRSTEFNLNLITLDTENLAIPETEYAAVAHINSTEYTKICRELYTLSETVTIGTTADYIQFSVEGEIGAGKVKLQNNEGDKKEDSTILEVQENVELQFAIRYLNMFNKAAPLSPVTKLCLHTEQPLVVEYRIDEIGVLKFYLAPKISDE